jgi:hypothetical protein
LHLEKILPGWLASQLVPDAGSAVCDERHTYVIKVGMLPEQHGKQAKSGDGGMFDSLLARAVSK